MNILFTICGRGGSKGVKNKNIRNFLGVPLFEYTLSAIELYKNRTEEGDKIDIAFSTDSIQFIELLNKKINKNYIIIQRDADLAKDDTPKMHVIADALKKSEVNNNLRYQMIVDLDITSPIRRVEDIVSLIEKKKSNLHTDVVFSVTHARRNPYFNMVCRRNGKIAKVLESNYVTRQQAPEMFDMNASMYAYSREFLLSGVNSPLNGICEIIIMSDTGIIDIDSENDFLLMEVVYKWLIEKDDECKEIYETAIKRNR